PWRSSSCRSRRAVIGETPNSASIAATETLPRSTSRSAMSRRRSSASSDPGALMEDVDITGSGARPSPAGSAIAIAPEPWLDLVIVARVAPRGVDEVRVGGDDRRVVLEVAAAGRRRGVEADGRPEPRVARRRDRDVGVERRALASVVVAPEGD